MNKVKTFIERNDEGTYFVYVDLEDNTLNYGIHGMGETKEDAIKDFLQSYEDMKDFYKAKGNDFVEAEFTFHYDVPSFLRYYNQYLTLTGLSKLTGINKAQLSHYIQGVRTPSPATAQKIETSLHNFAKELNSVRFV